MGTFQVKTSNDAVSERANALLKQFTEQGGYPTQGAALEGMLPFMERAVSDNGDPEVAAQVAEAERLTAAIVAQVNHLASRIVTARSEERAKVEDELADIRATAEERAVDLVSADKRIEQLEAELADTKAALGQATADKLQVQAQLNAVLGLTQQGN